MRKDIFEIVTLMNKDTKPNFSAIARMYNCDRRTVEKYYKNAPDNNWKTKSKI